MVQLLHTGEDSSWVWIVALGLFKQDKPCLWLDHMVLL